MCEAGLETSIALQRRGTRPETAWRGALGLEGGWGRAHGSWQKLAGLGAVMTGAETDGRGV